MAALIVAAPLLVRVARDSFLNLSLVTRIHPDRAGLRVEFAVPLPKGMIEAAGSPAHYELLEGDEAEALRAWLNHHTGEVPGG